MHSTALAFETFTSFAEQRRSERVRISLPALIYAEGLPHSAQLHNLSAGGALLKTHATIAVGDRVELFCGTIRAPATIRRKVSELVAIEFETRLPDRQLSEQVYREEAIANRRSRLGAIA